MKNHLSKLSLVLIGFVGGVAFLISCGGGGGDGTTASLPGLPDIPISEADAGALPVINDQMFCIGSPTSFLNEVSTSDTLICMKQSTKVKQAYKSLAGVYAEGWIMISMQGTSAYDGGYLFYR